MAEQEDIVIIEDSDETQEESSLENKKQSNQTEEQEEQKKLLIFGALAIALVIILVIVALIVVVKVKKKQKPSPTIPTSQIEQKLEQKEPIKPSKLEHLIAKANYLYTTGQKQQALEIYEYIAQYSEAISQYNLGVARLKSKQYKEALESFNAAIDNGEKRCVSAINAAVCSLYLKNYEDFKYYIDLAEAYLPNEINAPMYPYYYGLIKFYKQNYYEALVGIEKVDQNDYKTQKDLLKTKLLALFGNSYSAIESLEEIKNQDIPFEKGVLYANIGDLALAKTNFEDAILKGFHLHRATLGLIFTKLKLGQIKSAVEDLKSANERYGDSLLDPYPIKVFVLPELFDPLSAQERFRENFFHDISVLYQEVFYFSPYKIFNANQTINYIRKGNATSYIDSIDTAKEFLQKSVSTSSVNQGIAKAIKYALGFRIRKANKILQSLVKIQPKHSILHYDLALTYAQLGDMQNAYKHFLWSYHLDSKNYLSGLYAYMASKLINKTDRKLLNTIKESLSLEDDNEEVDFYKTLLHFSQENYLSCVDWLDNKYKTRPIYLIISNIVANKLHRKSVALEKAKKLQALLPKEILPNLIYINTKLQDAKKPYFAKESAKFLKNQDFIYKDLYYGANITRELFVQEKLLTGRLYGLVKRLENEIARTTKDTIDMQLTLAQAYFYDREFEKSYVLYNHLIDEVKIRDAKTLFLAAVSAIEAKHHENAIALLELSKLKDRNYLETRYALGLLYFEVNNARGGSIEFGNMPTFSFHSKYFNFDIDLDKLTFLQQHPKE